MNPVKNYHQKGTLAVEFITLPDGVQVTKNYDKMGMCSTEERHYRKDGTLRMKKQCDKKGQRVKIQYDKSGRNPIKDTKPIDETRGLVSKKRSKSRVSSNQKQKGE